MVSGMPSFNRVRLGFNDMRCGRMRAALWPHSAAEMANDCKGRDRRQQENQNLGDNSSHSHVRSRPTDLLMVILGEKIRKQRRQHQCCQPETQLTCD